MTDHFKRHVQSDKQKSKYVMLRQDMESYLHINGASHKTKMTTNRHLIMDVAVDWYTNIHAAAIFPLV